MDPQRRGGRQADEPVDTGRGRQGLRGVEDLRLGHGPQRRSSPIDDAVVATHGDAAARKELETRLAAVLKTGASRAPRISSAAS